MQKLCLDLFLVFVCVSAQETWNPAKLVEREYGYTSLCTEDYCDTLDVPEPGPGDRFVLVSSSKSGERFNYTRGNFVHSNGSDSDAKSIILQVNREKIYKNSKIFGFGGAFTSTVSHLLSRMTSKLRECFYNSYFSYEDGARYSLIRIPIGCCDFDLERWAYNLSPENDYNLSNFTRLDPRDVRRNKQIKEMRQITGQKNIQIIGCAWTPPPWMKAQNSWNCSVENRLRPECYETWANYHVKWVKLMRRDGMPIWGLSTGNEPDFTRHLANYDLTFMNWDAADQSKWLVENFAPALRREGLSDVRILGFEDIRNETMSWLNKMDESHPFATDLMDMIAIHPYSDDELNPNVLQKASQQFQLPILYTEYSFFGILPGSWERAENLTNIIMRGLERNLIGYIDWNMMLNATGGPSNGDALIVDACFTVNDNFTAFEKQPMFYAMAHFSRFIPPGSIRIDSSISGTADGIKALAYLRPDRKISIILVNTADEAVSLIVDDISKGNAKITLNARSINSFVYSTRNRRFNGIMRQTTTF